MRLNTTRHAGIHRPIKCLEIFYQKLSRTSTYNDTHNHLYTLSIYFDLNISKYISEVLNRSRLPVYNSLARIKKMIVSKVLPFTILALGLACNEGSFESSQVPRSEQVQLDVKEENLEIVKKKAVKDLSMSEEVIIGKVHEFKLPSDMIYAGASVTQDSDLGKIIDFNRDLKIIKYLVDDIDQIGKSDLIKLSSETESMDYSLSINIKVKNTDPIVQDVLIDANVNSVVEIELKGIDPDGSPLEYNIPAELPTGIQSWNLDPSGKLSVTLLENHSDDIEFSYSAFDGFSASQDAQVKVVLNSTVVGSDLAVSVVMNKSVGISLVGEDADDSQLAFEVLGVSQDKGVVSNFDGIAGTFDFTPPLNFVGDIKFSYRVSDGKSSAESSIVVSVTNNAPVLKESILEKHLIAGGVLSLNISDLGLDPDGHSLQIMLDSEVPHGVLSIDGDTVTYASDTNFKGTLDVKYRLFDGHSSSDVGIIRLVICANSVGMGIWSDLDSDGSIYDSGNNLEERFLGFIRTYHHSSTKLTAVQNYAYSNYSAHIKTGPVMNQLMSNIFFVEDKEGMNLYVIHNKHGEGGANTVHWNIEVIGNDDQDSLLFRDDSNDTYNLSRIAERNSNSYNIKWTYSSRTDGAVIGPIQQSKKVDIWIQYVDNGNITNVSFYSSKDEQGNESVVNLTANELQSSSFIISTEAETVLCK